jgi:hypothetical protein
MPHNLKSAQLQACVTDCFAVRPSTRQNESIKVLRSLLRANITVWGRDEVRAELLLPVARAHNCPVVAGRQKAFGRSVLDRDAAEYQTAHKALQRLVDAVLGVERPRRSEPQDDSIDKAIQRDVTALVARYKDELSSRRLLRDHLRKALETL